MEFITMSFAEIIALQNIINKDEEEEPKKVSKKARKSHSFNKGERAQMKKKAVEKRAKALGVKGSVEEGRDFYNAVAKINHYATGKDMGRLYNAECRNIKRRDAEKRLMKNEDWGTNPWQEDFLTKDEFYLPLWVSEAKDALEAARKELADVMEEMEEVNFFLDSFEGEEAGTMSVVDCYKLYKTTLEQKARVEEKLNKAKLVVRQAQTNYDRLYNAYNELPFWA